MIRLAEHVLFQELPFCGVLLDKRDLRLFRLSQKASAALRAELRGLEATGPYASLLGQVDAVPEKAVRRRVVAVLGAQGLIRADGDD